MGENEPACIGMSDDGDFSTAFAHEFRRLLSWRRDVRHFLPTPVAPDLIAHLLALTQCSPSVGYSQPWRFVAVESPERRETVYSSVERANAQAHALYADDDACRYARLKLSGLREAPIHLAVFCDVETQTGKHLGRRTMPETLCYSTAMAIYTFWLAARVQGLGVGWVSILHPAEITACLDVPETWQLVGYLAVGYPVAPAATPELVTEGWEKRDERSVTLLRR